jgi:hypothetical protein
LLPHASNPFPCLAGIDNGIDRKHNCPYEGIVIRIVHGFSIWGV